MLIRAAKAEDLTYIAALHALSWQQNYQQALSAEFLQEQVLHDRTNLWNKRFSHPEPNQQVLLAELDGHFAGFICVYAAHHPEYGSLIDNLHVEPNMKGKGIGSLLMQQAAQWLEQQHPDVGVYLEVLACNTKAAQFYQSRQGQNTASGYWSTPCGNQVEEFIYTWENPRRLQQACG